MGKKKKNDNQRREYETKHYVIYYLPITGEIIIRPKKRSIFGMLNDHHDYINHCGLCGQRVKLFMTKNKSVICEHCKKD
jgi:hypothetical protein